MGTRTGKSPGRPKGAKNKRTKQLDPSVRKAVTTIEAAIIEPFLGNAHAYLISIYKDPAMGVELRMEAAKAAIRYETPVLTPVAPAADGEEIVPLAECLKAYAMRDAIEASEGKVVPIVHDPRP